ncbi:MAG TPA: glutathione S-transferase [Gammaproteobacteria bacterium]|jgi:glutathione S-transferase|nr:glutathione S-transferase [Gammaproteobacteria bacterium]OUX33985.1 MAG: glutathione S-transferase [Gammaproteobacteria bacterium TMED260]RPG44335.1 MAG: glutathione S-transferase family protein [Gammaproteobacteria bacterium TMED163]HAO89204.1 glutathione S-transferase [Gammaproteobacteria bacterium]HAU25477.1 glutathione S-transferase [Gammaproteobacteria bacterium]|tara:strand:+ start:227 stop:847 length:621 start_codon:yes stop_codon:yes gene_type:complete
MKLFHCYNSRSLRPLWCLEEMGLDYELEIMPFPPRFEREGYLDINPLGTVPAFTDDGITLTESTGICQYLVQKYGPTPLAVTPDEPGYGDFLNWLYRSDATFTFPLALILRYTKLEPEERMNPQVVEDYTIWFFSRIRAVEAALDGKEFLVADRFTIADIAVGYALHFGMRLGLSERYKPNTTRYLQALLQRPAFKRTQDIKASQS